MAYRFALFFLFLWYIRPQDWFPGLIGVSIIKPVMLVWLVLLLASDARSRTPLQGILKTPHDWAMLIYFGYVVWAAPPGIGVASGFFPLVAFYALTVQSLPSWDKVLGYLRWWNWMLVGLALMGVLSLYGIDITGAKDVTESMRGRLSLGTWMHNNPNALGHSVVAAIPLSYILLFWRGSAMDRTVLFPLVLVLVGICAWETESKGAFLVGGMLVVLIFVIGRPKIVQIGAICMAAALGVSALSFLPRMEDMGNLRADEGVQGRLLAWEQARQVTKTETYGVGWKQFNALIPWREGNRRMVIEKATHSSYVQVAADLGVYGLFIYLGVVWTAVHSLLIFKSKDDDQERCKRALILLICANMISGWMINRQYHTEYFLLVAVAAAMHRLRLTEAAKEERPVESGRMVVGPMVPTVPAGFGGDLMGGAGGGSMTVVASASGAGIASPERRIWNRLGFLDLAVIASATWFILWAWDYLLVNI